MKEEEAKALVACCTTRSRPHPNPHGWNSLEIDILRDDEKVGEYLRNYPNLYETFQPFVQDAGNGDYQVYALYSRHYTATRLMRLPDCVDVGGEEPHGAGFCPTGFYVPYAPEQGLTGRFGFVSGCLWGDDSTWKVQFLDLNSAAEGILRRDERFGSLELPQGLPLRDAISLKSYREADPFGMVYFTVTRTYFLRQNRYPEPFE